MFFVVLLIFAQCSDRRRFTVYKNQPYDDISYKFDTTRIFRLSAPYDTLIDNHFRVKFLRFYSNGTFSIIGASTGIEEIVGHFMARRNILSFEYFGTAPGATFKKFLVEFSGYASNDSVIFVNKVRCKFCKNKIGRFIDTESYFYDPPQKMVAFTDTNIHGLYDAWFKKKSWYQKKVWYNHLLTKSISPQ